VIPDLKDSLAKTDVANTVKVFDGTHHGFCFAERAVYNAEAAEQTWTDIFDLWKRKLA
jgi:carboxymethylenebutenolidase